MVATLFAVALATPTAASDDESALSLSLGYGTYDIPDHSPHGGVLGIDYERGFSDALSLRVSGGAGAYYEDGQTTYTSHVVAGMTYLFDVIKYVPYTSAGLGAIVIAGGEQDTQVNALVELGVGLDVLHSRAFSYGIQAKLEKFLESTAFFTAGMRVTWRWGFF